MANDELTHQLLVAYAAGDLAAEDRARVEALLTRDADARAALHFVRTVINVMRTDDTQPASDAARARAKALFDPAFLPAAPHPTRPGLLQLVAELLFDSRLQPSPTGFREAADGVQLAYRAADVDVDIRLDPPGERDDLEEWEVVGQISVETTDPVTLTFRSQDAPAAALPVTVSSDGGYFRTRLRPGAYTAEIAVGDRIIILGDLHLP